jgi:predicted metalloprotease
MTFVIWWLVLVLAAGCTTGAGWQPVLSVDHPSDDQISDAQLQVDIDTAINVVNEFWADHWTDYFQGEYEPPEVAGGYDATNGPTCHGEPAEAMNAFYCPEGDYIAWDIDLMRTYYEGGKNDVFPYIVIAHEWGHAITHRLDPSYSADAPELQADCLAGLAIYGAVRDETLMLEDGDGNEMAKTYYLLGDNIPWADPSEHGDGVDRVAAFAAGRSGDIENCIPDTGGR